MRGNSDGGDDLEALLKNKFLPRKFCGDKFGVHGQSVVVENAAQLGYLGGGKIELEQAGQLRVAVLLDDKNALMRGHKVVNLLGKRPRPDAQIIHVLGVTLLDLVEAFDEGAIGGTEGQITDLRGSVPDHDRCGKKLAHGLKLARQTVHYRLI